MAQSAPAAIALARSPENLMPPSAITGTSRLRHASTDVEDRRELRHADAGDDARGADRAGADADLDRVGAGIDQRLGAFARWRRCRRRSGCSSRAAGCARTASSTRSRMAVRGIDHQHVDAGIEQRLGALDAVLAGAGRGGDAQPPVLVLAGVGKALRLLDVLDGDEADAAIGVVDHDAASRCGAGAGGAWPPRAARSRAR